MKRTVTLGFLISILVLGAGGLLWEPAFGQPRKELSKEHTEALNQLTRSMKAPVFKAGLSKAQKAEALRELDSGITQLKQGSPLPTELRQMVQQWERLSQTQKEQILAGKSNQNNAATAAVVAKLAVCHETGPVFVAGRKSPRLSRFFNLPNMSKQQLDVLKNVLTAQPLDQGNKARQGVSKQPQVLKGLSKEQISIVKSLSPNQRVPVLKAGLTRQQKAEAIQGLNGAMKRLQRKGGLSRELTAGVRQWERLSQAQKEQILAGRKGSIMTVEQAAWQAATALVGYYVQEYMVEKVSEAAAGGRFFDSRRLDPRELDMINAARQLSRNPVSLPSRRTVAVDLDF